jgi:hypothetical protein
MTRNMTTLISVIFLCIAAGTSYAADSDGPVVYSSRQPTLPSKQLVGSEQAERSVAVHLFWGEGCAHCEEERRFLANLTHIDHSLHVTEYEVLKNKRNLELLTGLMHRYGKQPSGVPITFIGDRVFAGFSTHVREMMVTEISRCRVESCRDPVEPLRGTGPTVGRARPEGGMTLPIPFLGTLDMQSLSLPALTFVIAGMDSFNPCAFFVLLSLLGLLVHARSRNKMLLVGGVFIFFSAFISLLVMAAWLNLFLVMANVSSVTTAAGIVSLVIGAINVKDFFAFKKGVSLSIPDSVKPRLFDRMRRLIRSTSLLSILAGTTVLAILANFYELLCTAGFPIVFTRVLTLGHLPIASSYLYLILYNVIRVVPLFIIVLIFTITLGRRKLTEQQGRFLKLISGTMMLGLSGMLLLDPALLNSLTIALSLMTGSIGVALVLAAITRRLGYY